MSAPERLPVSQYLDKYQLQILIEDAVNECYKDQAADPAVFFADYFARRTQVDLIERVNSRQVLDSRGNPTVEVDIIVAGKVVGRAAGPSGASTGSREANELRDGGPDYHGRGVTTAVENVKSSISGFLSGQKVDLIENDRLMLTQDGTPLKTNLGGNAITATSFALAYAGAHLAGEEPFLYLARKFNPDINLEDHKFRLPRPMVNIINGGKHAGGDLMIQEFMVVPRKDISFSETVRMISQVYHTLKRLLSESKGPSAINVGDEGGFAPNISSPDEALTFLEKAITESGFRVGVDLCMAIDAAATEFYTEETGYEVIKGEHISSEELVQFYVELVEKHPALISIEDGHDESDFEGWKLMTERLGDRILVVGDDLYTTNPETIRKGIQEKWANSLLLKVNQIGTITESMEAARLLFDANQEVIVSHRSGETCTSLIADLVVALGAGFIKTGAPARGERTCKYNRLLQIEEYLQSKGMLLPPEERS